VIYVVSGLSRVSVPAEAAGVPGSVLDQDFTFPRRVFVAGVKVIPASGDPADLASLSLRIFDEDDRDLVTDLRGVVANGEQLPNAQPLLALMGRGFGVFPLQRIVHTFDRWRFSAFNFGGGIVKIASVGIYFGEAPPL
jgi:hypothetical protein